MRRCKRIVAVVAWAAAVGLCGEGRAVADEPRLERWVLPLATGPELRNPKIVAMARDGAGGLWFASPSGLTHFDPKTRASREHALPGTISALVADSLGAVWAATSAGVVRIEPSTGEQTVHKDEDSLFAPDASLIEVDRDGKIWCYSSSNSPSRPSRGLSRFDPGTGTWTKLTKEHDGVPAEVSAFLQDKSGALWIADFSGVVRVDPATKARKEIRTDDGLPHPGVRAMLEDREGMLWLATYGGLARMDPATYAITGYHTFGGLADDRVTSLVQDADGALWIGTEGGLSRMDPAARTFTTIKRKDGLPDDRINDLLLDAEGALWIATEGGGAVRLDRATRAIQGAATSRDDVTNEDITALSTGPGAVLWASTSQRGTQAYRLELASGAWSSYSSREGLDVLRAAMLPSAGASGAVWVGDALFDPKTGTFRSRKIGADAVARDAQGSLYFADILEVTRFDPATEHKEKVYRASGEAPRDVAVDAAGVVWLATDKGVLRVDPAHHIVTEMGEKDGLPGTNVSHVLLDGAGDVWAATDGGAARYDREKKAFVSYTEKDGLLASRATSLWLDADGAMWIGASGGVTRWDAKTQALTRYGAAQGLEIGAVHSITRTPDGALWLGSERGVTRVVLDGDEAGAVFATAGERPRLAFAGGTLAVSRPNGLALIDTAAAGGPRLSVLPAFPAGARLTALVPGPGGAFWVGTQLGGLTLRGQDRSLALAPAGGLPSMSITALARPPRGDGGELWAGTTAGPAFVRLENGALRAERVRWDGMPRGPVDAIAAAEDGSALVAFNALPAGRIAAPEAAAQRSRTRLFHVSNKGLVAEVPLGEPVAKLAIRSMAVDPQRRLWLGTSEGLFSGPAPGGPGGGAAFAPVADTALAASPIDKIAAAPDGALWLMSGRKGTAPPRLMGYQPDTGALSTLALEGADKDWITDLALGEDGTLVVAWGSAIARAKVAAAASAAAASPAAPAGGAGGMGLFIGVGMAVVLGAGIAFALFRRKPPAPRPDGGKPQGS